MLLLLLLLLRGCSQRTAVLRHNTRGVRQRPIHIGIWYSRVNSGIHRGRNDGDAEHVNTTVLLLLLIHVQNERIVRENAGVQGAIHAQIRNAGNRQTGRVGLRVLAIRICVIYTRNHGFHAVELVVVLARLRGLRRGHAEDGAVPHAQGYCVFHANRAFSSVAYH